VSKNNYYVIGGQYEAFNHGGAPTLLGAKRLAGKNEEYWDNWQGWHRPNIYAAADCCEVTNFYGTQLLPKSGVIPVAVWDANDHCWITPR
jgi:hypothetical protein